MKHQRANRRGTVLILVIVLLLIVVTIAGSIVHVLVMDARQYRWDHHGLQAARLAESGLRRAHTRLAANPKYPGQMWALELPSGPAEIAITIRTENNTRVIESRATFPADSESPVRATLRREGGTGRGREVEE